MRFQQYCRYIVNLMSGSRCCRMSDILEVTSAVYIAYSSTHNMVVKPSQLPWMVNQYAWSIIVATSAMNVVMASHAIFFFFTLAFVFCFFFVHGGTVLRTRHTVRYTDAGPQGVIFWLMFLQCLMNVSAKNHTMGSSPFWVMNHRKKNMAGNPQ